MDEDKLLKLSIMVDKLTTSRKSGPEDAKLKELKKLCKSSEEYVKHTYHFLIHQLQKEHSEVRLNAVIVINEIFTRSHVFRELLVSSFQPFLELTVETDPDQPLPPPQSVAKLLRIKTLEFVQKWYKDFGEGYKKLGLGYTFLKQCKQVDFNNIQARNAIERQREEIQQRHFEDMNQKRTDKAVEEMIALREEIDETLVQLESCFRLLLPHPDDFFVKDGNVSEPINNEVQLSLENKDTEGIDRGHGLHDRNLSIEIKLSNKFSISDNKDNHTVIENAKDMKKLMTRKLKPKLEKIISVFTKTGQNREKLKESINLKKQICDQLNKFDDLNITALQLCDNDTSDDDFEEVPDKEGYEPVIPQHRRQEYGLEPLSAATSNASKSNFHRRWGLVSAENSDANDPTTIAAQLNTSKSTDSIVNDGASTSKEPDNNTANVSDKAKRLEVAPKLRYDMDLYVWEEEKLEPPSVVTYESLHRFWTPINNEGSSVVKEEQVASMRERIIDFSGKFEKVKWSCRALLPSGRLCPRRDRLKCPFHGPIIPRNNVGAPSNDEDHKKEKEAVDNKVDDWQDPKLLADIKAEIGIDLTIKKKGSKGKKRKNNSDLTDIKKTENTARNRLERKLLNPRVVKKIEENLNQEKQKLYDDKFGNQWSYSFDS